MSACSCCSPVPRNVPGGQGELSKYLWFGWRDRQTDGVPQMVSLQQCQEAEARGSQDLRAEEQWGPWGWEVAA